MIKKSIGLFLFLFSILQGYAQGPGCASINAGPDQTLPCNVTCTTLSATFLETGATTSYAVSAIPYAPPAPTTPWNSSFVNTDDIWSGVINLPFTFCYYGTNYTQLVIGANGVISFNTGYANQFCPWAFTASIPSANLPLNAIFGAYHDIDPSVCGTIQYAISGNWPCRTFMFDFNQVCHYDCNNLRTTQRIVLYETSNVIEVYIGNKPTCNGWNGGRAVIGIQNAAGDVGLVAPGRQTGNWSAANEAWRFTPNGAPNYSITWYANNVPGPIGTGPTIDVCATGPFNTSGSAMLTYSALITYTNCNNEQVVVSDEVGVNLTGPGEPFISNNSPICSGQNLQLTTSPVNNATYYWSGPGGWTSSLQNPTRPSATAAMSGTYSLYIMVNGCSSTTNTMQVTIIDASTIPVFTTNTPVCVGSPINFDANTYPGATYVWSGPGGWNPGNVENPTRPNATAAMAGVYSLYIVANGCTSGTATQNVTVNPIPATPAISSNSPVCTQNTINLFGPTVPGATYFWTGPGGWTSSLEDPTRPNANLAMAGTYSLYVVVGACTSLTATTNVVINGPPIPEIQAPQEICAGETANLFSQTYPGATYHWSGPNGFTSNLEDPPIPNVSAASQGTYSLYLVQNGCTSITVTSFMAVNTPVAPVAGSNSPVCEGGTINLSANTIAGATYFWSGPNGFSSGLEDPSIAAATPAMSGTYSLYTVEGSCTSVTSTVNVTVNATPTVNANADQTICQGGTSTALGGVIGGSATGGLWTSSAGGTFNPNANTLNATWTPPAGYSGNATLTLTTTGMAPCPAVSINRTVTVIATPTVDAGSDLTICQESTTIGLGGTVGGGATGGTWTSSVGGTFNPDANTLGATWTAPVGYSGTATLTLTTTGMAPCAAISDTKTITVRPTPIVDAGTGQTICQGGTTTALSGSIGGAATGGTWTTSAGGTFSPNANTLNATWTPPAGFSGTATLTLSTTGSAPCQDISDDISVIVSPTPTVDAGADETICQGGTTNPLNGITGGSATGGTWSTPSGGTFSPDANTLNATWTPPPGFSGTATLTLTSTGMAPCAAVTDTKIVTVSPTPTVDAGLGQTICQGGTTSALSGSIGGAATGGTWSSPAGGTFTPNANTLNATWTPPAGFSGTATLTLTTTGMAPCAAVSDFIDIIVSPTPTVNAGADETICQGGTTAALSGLIGGSASGGTWSTPAGGTFTPDANTLNATWTPPAGFSGTATLTLTTTGMAPCAVLTDTKDVIVSPTPSVDAGAGQTICQGGTTTALSGTIGGAATGGTWSTPDGGTFTPDANTLNATWTPPAGFSGTATLTLTTTGMAPCPSVTDVVDIIVSPTPVVDAGIGETICQGSTTSALSGSIGGSATGGTWSTPAGGTFTPNANTLNATWTPPAGFSGTATLTLTTTGMAPCAALSDPIDIVVSPTPTVNAGPDETICQGGATAALGGTVGGAATGGTWTSSDGGTFTPDANTLNATWTPPAGFSGTATLTLSTTGMAPCPAVDDTRQITVLPTPTVDAGVDLTICQDETTVGLGGSIGGSASGATWTSSVGGTFTPDANTLNATWTPVAGYSGTATLTLTTTGMAPCAAVSATKNVIVNPVHIGTPVNVRICPGDTYSFGGQDFNSAGSYPVLFQNIYNCDSTVTLNVSMIPANGNPPPGNYFNTGNNGAGGTLPGGSPDAVWTVSSTGINGPYIPATVMSSTPGSYYNSPWADCDWIAHNADGSHAVDQSFFYQTQFELPCANFCGDSYTIPDIYCLNLDFFADNSVYEIYINGVPQSATIGNMPVPNPYYANGFGAAGMVSVSLCDGWLPGTNTITVEIVSGPGNAGFLAQSSVNPPPPLSDTASASICDGETYVFGTQNLTTSGTYTEVFTILPGCDSTATLLLTVNPTYTGTAGDTICNGDSVTFGGQTFNAAGSYPVMFTTVNGCDSLITFDVTLFPEYNESVTASICQGETYSFLGNDYTAAGDYVSNLQTINGCDSIVTLTLTVRPLPVVNINMPADQCFNGNSYDFSLVGPYPAGTTYNWNFPGGSPATSAIAAPQNVSYAAAGTYPVTASVTENGCTDSSTVDIIVLASPNVQFNALPPVGCVPLTVNFSDLSTPGGGSFNWDFGNGQSSTQSTSVQVYNTPGTYTITLTVTLPNGCTETLVSPGLINALPNPTAGFSINPQEVEIVNPTVNLIDGSSNASNVIYYIDNGSSVTGPDAVYNFTAEGIYEVMQVVTSTGGCADTAYGQVIVSGTSEVFIPNVFTPNDDDLNSGFGVVGNGFDEFKMMIFNRWGELLFESQDPNLKWDGTYRGKECKVDVYVYRVEYRDYKGKQQTALGSVTLLR